MLCFRQNHQFLRWKIRSLDFWPFSWSFALKRAGKFKNTSCFENLCTKGVELQTRTKSSKKNNGAFVLACLAYWGRKRCVSSFSQKHYCFHKFIGQYVGASVSDGQFGNHFLGALVLKHWKTSKTRTFPYNHFFLLWSSRLETWQYHQISQIHQFLALKYKVIFRPRFRGASDLKRLRAL